MNYLCAKHQMLIANSGKDSGVFWNRAMKFGKKEFEASNWARAESFFGAAYEIALICLEQKSQTIDISKPTKYLSEAGHWLTETLCLANKLNEAERCLEHISQRLLLLSHRHLLSREQHCEVLLLSNEFSDRMGALENLKTKQISHDMLTYRSLQINYGNANRLH